MLPEFKMTAVISFAHVTKDEAEILNEATEFPIQGQICDGHGTMLYLPPDRAPKEFQEIFVDLGLRVETANLFQVLALAGAHYLILDSDGPVVDGWETFDW